VTTREIGQAGLWVVGVLWSLWMLRCLVKWPPWTWSERVERHGIGDYTVSRGRETIGWMIAPGTVLLLIRWAFVSIVG
jgi:hypothetical protein